MLIRLCHGPNPDNALMFWALAQWRIDDRGFEFEHVLAGAVTAPIQVEFVGS